METKAEIGEQGSGLRAQDSGISRAGRAAAAAALTLLAAIAVAWMYPLFASDAPPRVLRVCADPNNLPFSNARLEGFENRISELIAAELHVRVEYTWWAQRRGFVRETVGAGACDVVPGVPTTFERTLVTRPYYRSTYVFVSRRDRSLRLRGLDDPALTHLKIGVQLIGEDGTNTPPAHALARRHLAANIVGFTLYGDYSRPNPPARILEAVAAGEVDVAVVWGPLAGYFARREPTPLAVTPVGGPADPMLPMAYDISVGVSRGAKPLLGEIDRVLERRHVEIARILSEYGVPSAGGAHAR
jgi:mxaJ protein